MDYEQAEYWADKAIELDPSFTKGFYRRGMARLHLLKFKEAKSDFTHVLQDSPQDSSAKKQINICNQKIKEAAFLEAIRIEEFELTLENIEKIEISPNYKGLRVPDDLNIEFVLDLIAQLKEEIPIPKHDVLMIMFKAKQIFEQQPSLVDINFTDDQKMIVCGDVHGQFFDFIKIFEELTGYPSPQNLYLFNGDFVDRGPYALEILLVMLSLKAVFPNHFYMSRGNHEFSHLNKIYGFEKEVLKKYDEDVFLMFVQLFNTIPIAHVINQKVFVVHGGLCSDRNVTLDDIRKIDRRTCPESNLN